MKVGYHDRMKRDGVTRTPRAAESARMRYLAASGALDDAAPSAVDVLLGRRARADDARNVQTMNPRSQREIK